MCIGIYYVCVCIIYIIYIYCVLCLWVYEITSWRMALVKAKRRVAEQIDMVRYLSAKRVIPSGQKKKYVYKKKKKSINNIYKEE